MTIAMTGATGQLGRLIVQELKQRLPEGSLRGIVRSADKAKGLGIDIREASYEDPHSLREALHGVSTLLLISSSEVGRRARQHRNVLEAAKAAGVQRIVYTSILHADRSPIESLAAEHRDTELALRESSVAHTILRNGWYTENYTNSIPAALASGAFIGSAGEGEISSAARADYASAAVAVLTQAGHEGKTYELAGDTAWTLSALAAEITRQSGRDIPYWNLPEEEYAAILAGAGLPEWLAKAVPGWDTGAALGGLFDDSRQLSQLLGRPTTPLAVTVAESLRSAGIS